MSKIINKGGQALKKADNESVTIRWLRPKAAKGYYHMGQKAIDKIAVNCDAKKKVGDKIVLYDIQRIDRYLMTL
jgi:hypothetical protein